jgi:hypothetical protein
MSDTYAWQTPNTPSTRSACATYVFSHIIMEVGNRLVSVNHCHKCIVEYNGLVSDAYSPSLGVELK